MSSFSKKLGSLREQKGWTKTMVAKHLGIPVPTYSNYEYGNREPDIKTINLIANMYGVSVDYLLGNESSHKTTSDNKTALTWDDLGVPMPYGGNIPDELKETYADLAKSYFKRHPELLNQNKK